MLRCEEINLHLVNILFLQQLPIFHESIVNEVMVFNPRERAEAHLS